MAEDRFDTRGCVAVVTGAASGIGRAIAVALGERGARVMLADVDATGLDQTSAAVEAAGGSARVRLTDVSDRAAWVELASATEDAFGPAQLLVNNAGVMTRAQLADSDDDDWAWTLGVNLHGVVEGVRAFLPQLRANTGNGTNARIMNTGSMAGVAPRLGGGLGAYSASKAAVVVYSEILREELAPEGIGVSVLCPGTVISGIWEAERNRPEQLGEGHRVPPPDRSAQAMPASQVAATVLAGIEENEAFIFTHADSRGRIEERFERIAASLDALDAALATSEAGGTT